MNILEIIILSLTICIDSFVLCLTTKVSKWKYYLIVPFTFTLFQGVFSTLGFLIGNHIEIFLLNSLKYIMFLIYSFMAVRLLIETIYKKDNVHISSFSLKFIIFQAFTSSFDSFFVTLPISFHTFTIQFIISLICSVTFIVCILALLLQSKIKNSSDIYNIIGAIILFIFAFKGLI